MMADMMKDKENAAPAPRFTKGQLLAAARFADSRDALSALLEADGLYTAAEVQKMLARYRKGRVR